MPCVYENNSWINLASPAEHGCHVYLCWCAEQGWHSCNFLVEQEQLEDSNELNNRVLGAGPVTQRSKWVSFGNET